MFRGWQGCHDLSAAWPHTNTLQHHRADDDPIQQMDVDGSVATASTQRRRPCSLTESAAAAADQSPLRPTTSSSNHCSTSRDLYDKYGIFDTEMDRGDGGGILRGNATTTTDAGAIPLSSNALEDF